MITLLIIALVYVTINLTLWGVHAYEETNTSMENIGYWVLYLALGIPLYIILLVWIIGEIGVDTIKGQLRK